MEEFGGIDGSYGGQTLKAIGYLPLRAVVRDCASASDAVIATDEAIVPAVRRHLPVDESRVRLIPNGLDVVDLDRIVDAGRRHGVRAAAGIADDETVLLSVGRLEANKGFADLAEALAGLDSPVRWRWVLAGDGPARTALVVDDRAVQARRSRDTSSDAWTTRRFMRGTTPRICSSHPTRYEGSSLVTLEAMLHRMPVVATRAGGLPDKVMPGETGWLAEPASPDALGRRWWRRWQAGRGGASTATQDGDCSSGRSIGGRSRGSSRRCMKSW